MIGSDIDSFVFKWLPLVVFIEICSLSSMSPWFADVFMYMPDTSEVVKGF